MNYYGLILELASGALLRGDLEGATMALAIGAAMQVRGEAMGKGADKATVAAFCLTAELLDYAAESAERREQR